MNILGIFLKRYVLHKHKGAYYPKDIIPRVKHHAIVMLFFSWDWDFKIKGNPRYLQILYQSILA